MASGQLGKLGRRAWLFGEMIGDVQLGREHDGLRAPSQQQEEEYANMRR